jgi:carboxylate-amine ligase
MRKVVAMRRAVLDLAEGEGVAIGVGGVHPFARWQDQGFVDTPGYQWVGHQLGYVARRNLSFGLHIHLGVEDEEARVYAANQFRRWCAPLLSLSANSPFFEGVDTGFETIRMYVFGAFPRTGYAPHLRDWAHYQEIIRRLMDSEAITLPRQIWWNVRPHPDYGTVELRMMDMQIDLARVRTFVALAQALTAGILDDHARGTPLWEVESAYLGDAWFKAQRFGWEAPIAHPVSGARVTLKDEIEAMLAAARPWAEALGTEDAAIEGVNRILREGPESDWQRAALEEAGGDLAEVQRRIIQRVRDEAREPELPGFLEGNGGE